MPDAISSDKTEYLRSKGITVTKIDEKDAVALFKIFLRKQFIDCADENWCRPGGIFWPGLLGIFLVQRGWQSYYGTPQGER